MILENYRVQELSFEETHSIDGGSRWKLLERAAALLSVGEAIDEFMDGWDSCSCDGPGGAGGSW